MPSVNEQLLDAFTGHAVDLARVEAGLQAEAVAMLQALEKDLVTALAQVDPTGPTRTAFQQQRLESLLTQVQNTIRRNYALIQKTIGKEIVDLAGIEQSFVSTALNEAIGVDLVTPVLDRQTLTALADENLIQGAPTKEWWARQSTDLQKRFTDQIRQGMLQGEPLGTLIQRIRGTRANRFTDGILRPSRRGAEALVRSSVQTVANDIRWNIYKEHGDLIKGMMWHSTLDARTTIQCQVRDGLLYSLRRAPKGHDIPWGAGPGALHWQCRSTSVPVTKSWKELSENNAVRSGAKTRPASIRKLYRRKLKEAGFSNEDITARMFQARSSMDGLVPRSLQFPDWLKQKDAASPGFGAQVLGPTRWGLWRSGQLSFKDLVNFAGEPLRIRDLAVKVQRVAQDQIRAEAVKRYPKLKALGDGLYIRSLEDLDNPGVQQALKDMSLIPPPLLDNIGLNVQVHVGNTNVTELDDLRYLAGKQPRGWDPGDVFEQVHGVYATQKSSGITFRRVAAIGVEKHRRPAAIHELGHALGDISLYNDDVRLIAAHRKYYDRIPGDYFKQGGPGAIAGRQEYLAEGLAELLQRRADHEDPTKYAVNKNRTKAQRRAWSDRVTGDIWGEDFMRFLRDVVLKGKPAKRE